MQYKLSFFYYFYYNIIVVTLIYKLVQFINYNCKLININNKLNFNLRFI